MAQFCHDQYDHPLLWCDDKRRAEERKIAQESLSVVRHRRDEQEAQKVRDVREVRQRVIWLGAIIINTVVIAFDTAINSIPCLFIRNRQIIHNLFKSNSSFLVFNQFNGRPVSHCHFASFPSFISHFN